MCQATVPVYLHATESEVKGEGASEGARKCAREGAREGESERQGRKGRGQVGTFFSVISHAASIRTHSCNMKTPLASHNLSSPPPLCYQLVRALAPARLRSFTRRRSVVGPIECALNPDAEDCTDVEVISHTLVATQLKMEVNSKYGRCVCVCVCARARVCVVYARVNAPIWQC